MKESKTTALELRAREAAPSRSIRLPDETTSAPAELTPGDLEPKPTAEEISKNELRLLNEAKDAPAPDRVLESLPMVKSSVIVPVEVNAATLRDFLDALAVIAHENAAAPILGNVRVTYTEGELLLEATNGRVWGMAKLKAMGSRDGFECVLPLKRARNVLQRILAGYANVPIGMDQDQIHLGNYSFPHGGAIRDYPPRMTLMAEELKAALPVHYIESILERLVPIVDDEHPRPNLRGVHLDFELGGAVATDGSRLHLLKLDSLQLEQTGSYRARPAVTISCEFFEYLRAVIDREWVGLLVSEKRVTAFGEDFAAMARPLEESFAKWRQTIPSYSGFWLVDKKAILETLEDAYPLDASYVRLAVDSIGEKLTVTARNAEGETYKKSITAQRHGGAPAVRCALDPDFLREAIEATEGGLVRIGFDDDQSYEHAVTISGEESDFLAVVMPCRED